MSLPYFFVSDLVDKTLTLDEPTSKHIVNVLRMQRGEEILVTDGKGKKARATILDDNRKKCVVEISSTEMEEESKQKIVIGISLIKNTSRFEWFLEKATEVGVSAIIPLICERTEKEKFRYERMHGILISAMLQSQQSRLPFLHEPTDFREAVQMNSGQKFIAHCLPSNKVLLTEQLSKGSDRTILIGPEGDFTENEVQLALQHSFQPVALGETRLRTETAGIVAATLLRFF
jgi:16S rRNA (uracil1498-N3)-methyltransferase